MLIFLLLAAALKSSSSVPLSSTIDSPDPPTPLTIFGRELPECVDPSRHRTLQDIIWSCLATIFACTWVAVHPNVPEPCTPWWKRLKDRIVIMVCALLAPELIILWALRQRMGAAQHMADYNRKFHLGETEENTFGSDLLGRHDPQCHEHNRKGPWTLTHGFLLEMRGLRRIKGRQTINGKGFVESLSARLSISEAEINDKSKGDFLTKLFVVLQTTWFIFQVLARWITHLPVTELEVVTLSFAFLNIITYALWWNKPQNMQVPIYVDNGDESEEDWHGRKCNEDITLAGIWRTIFRAPFRIAKFVIMIPAHFVDICNGYDDSPFYSSVDGGTIEVLVPMTFVGLIFGGLHFISLWASPFPSTAEKVLWIISVVWIITEPVLFLITASAADRNYDGFLKVVGLVFGFTMFVGSWFYVVARIILIVLAFTTLRDLRPAVYQNIEWTTFIPHF